MRGDPYKDIVWSLGLAAAGFGIYWLYQNGMLGYFGQCPAGFTASGGTCINSMSLVSAPGGPPPTTPLEPGMAWGWNGSAYIQVPTATSWNPTVTL